MTTNPLDVDPCIYMEANAGDGGVHNAAGVWWLSPDVDVATRDAAGKVPLGTANEVRVRPRKKNGCLVGGSPPPTIIKVQAYVAVPSAVIDPNNVNQTRRIDEFTVEIASLNQNGVNIAGLPNYLSIPWTPGDTNIPLPAGTPPDHWCLVARSFPDNLTPSSNNMFLPQDPHAAQHNIVFDRVPTGTARLRMLIATANPDKFALEQVVFQISADFNPPPRLLKYLTRRLERIEGFKQIARLEPGRIKRLLGAGREADLERAIRQTVPRRFGLEVPDELKARVYDFSRPARTYDKLGRLLSHRYLARFALQPEQLTFLPVVADLSETEPGTTHLFHVRHFDGQRKVRGGLTIVVTVV